MALQSLTLSVELTTINCGICGGTYAINERYRRDRQEKGEYWTCPYCKATWGYGEGENQRLRQQIAAEQARLARERAAHDQTRAELETRTRERNASRGATTRLRNRVRAGVCPDCKRSFANLRRHVADMHPLKEPPRS